MKSGLQYPKHLNICDLSPNASKGRGGKLERNCNSYANDEAREVQSKENALSKLLAWASLFERDGSPHLSSINFKMEAVS